MIEETIVQFKARLPDHVTLVAVSKTKPAEVIRRAYHTGHRIFGENKVQELVDKHAQLPEDIEWHMIGHLQTNKVKYIASFVSLIHGVDSLKLLTEINRQAAKHNRSIDVLLQFHIAAESTKFGLSMERARDMLTAHPPEEYPHVRICGVMGMATYTSDTKQIEEEFRLLSTYFDTLQSQFFRGSAHFSEISMGMSGDYRQAIDCGSTMIRIGSTLFGKR